MLPVPTGKSLVSAAVEVPSRINEPLKELVPSCWIMRAFEKSVIAVPPPFPVIDPTGPIVRLLLPSLKLPGFAKANVPFTRMALDAIKARPVAFDRVRLLKMVLDVPEIV